MIIGFIGVGKNGNSHYQRPKYKLTSYHYFRVFLARSRQIAEELEVRSGCFPSGIVG